MATPHITIFLLVVVVSTVSSASHYSCQAYDHERPLKVDGCESKYIPDRYCKGLCNSQHYPKLLQSSKDEENNEDEMKLVSIDGNPATANRYVCIPAQTEVVLHTVSCKRSRETTANFFPRVEWVYFEKMVLVNVTKSCSCQPDPNL